MSLLFVYLRCCSYSLATSVFLHAKFVTRLFTQDNVGSRIFDEIFVTLLHCESVKCRRHRIRKLNNKWKIEYHNALTEIINDLIKARWFENYCYYKLSMCHLDWSVISSVWVIRLRKEPQNVKKIYDVFWENGVRLEYDIFISLLSIFVSLLLLFFIHSDCMT